MTDYIEVVSTTANEEEAHSLARLLLDRRLAACVQIIGPISSIYRWQGEVEQQQEFQLVVKSRHDLFPALAELLQQHHSYEVPQIIALPLLETSAAYGKWLAGQLPG